MLEKLEITRAALELMDIPHHVVVDSLLPKQKVANLKWLHLSTVRPGEIEPSPGYFDDMARRFFLHALSAARASPSKSLQQVCGEFDTLHGAHAGTGLRVARILMVLRKIEPDLDQRSLAEAPMSSFRIPNRAEPRVLREA